MEAIETLMTEHRLIERGCDALVGFADDALRRESDGRAELARFVTFIRQFADGCHHGKEENILFRDLATKPLSAEHRQVMGELVAEHRFGRETTARLVEAKSRYVAGDSGVLTDIIDCFHTLAGFYPKHIEKEDRYFFVPVMRYFSPICSIRVIKRR